MSDSQRRLERSYKQTLHGKKDEIFELLCPVREKEWLRGWDYNLIYSKSGLAEKGCVFETDNDFGSYQWIMTKYDASEYEVQFVKFIQNKMIVVMDINLIDGEADIVYCDIEYSFTAIDDNIIDEMHEENTVDEFNRHMKLWEDSMNYFLKTGISLEDISKLLANGITIVLGGIVGIALGSKLDEKKSETLLKVMGIFIIVPGIQSDGRYYISTGISISLT